MTGELCPKNYTGSIYQVIKQKIFIFKQDLPPFTFWKCTITNIKQKTAGVAPPFDINLVKGREFVIRLYSLDASNRGEAIFDFQLTESDPIFQINLSVIM